VQLNAPLLPLAIFSVIFLIAVVLHLVAIKRLRNLHEREWERLGRPSLSSIGPLPGNFNLFSYNWSRSYRTLQDRALSRAFGALKVCDVLGVSSLIWYGVLFLFD
jgi:hypothetical protein